MFEYGENLDEKSQLTRGVEPKNIPASAGDIEVGGAYSIVPYTIAEHITKLVAEENRYKREKFSQLNSPERTSGGISKKSPQVEPKEARFFSSDPVKDKIMQRYWEPLRQGFSSAIMGGGSRGQPDEVLALDYLTPLIQRYFDLEKGHFDWRGSEITRFERDYLDKNFGILLPKRVAKDEPWESFVNRIEVGKIAKPKEGTEPKPVDVTKLKEHLKENEPLSLQALPDEIPTVQADPDSPDLTGNPISNPKTLIDEENRYKNNKFKKLGEGVLGIFSSKPEKDNIMKAYWKPLKESFEGAGRTGFSKDPPPKDIPYILVIIRRYYDMQKGHFDVGGSTINKFEREYLLEKHSIELPPPKAIAKNESWESFVERITTRTGGFSQADLRSALLKPENRPLSEKSAAAPSATLSNGPVHPKSNGIPPAETKYSSQYGHYTPPGGAGKTGKT